MNEKENENSVANPSSDLEQDSRNALLGKKENARFDSPVRIHIHSTRKRLADCDGISGKHAIDGLVLAGILQDDSSKFVKDVTFSQEKAKEEITIITIEEI